MSASKPGGPGMRRLLVLLLLATLVPAWRSGPAADGDEVKPRRHVVAISGFQFRPASLVVAVGDTVVWRNDDVVPHTANTATRDLDTGPIPAGESRAVVVTRRGEYAYLCAYHPTMKGRLLVR